MSKSIFDQLHSEHVQLKKLLNDGIHCEPSQRRDILEKIEAFLVPHARGEERTLYELLRERSEDQAEEDALDLTNEAFEEHRVVDELLVDLKGCTIRDEKWAPKLKVIKENLEHHIQEEEDELFEKARKLFSQDELDNILEMYMQERRMFIVGEPRKPQSETRIPPAESPNIIH